MHCKPKDKYKHLGLLLTILLVVFVVPPYFASYASLFIRAKVDISSFGGFLILLRLAVALLGKKLTLRLAGVYWLIFIVFNIMLDFIYSANT